MHCRVWNRRPSQKNTLKDKIYRRVLISILRVERSERVKYFSTRKDKLRISKQPYGFLLLYRYHNKKRRLWRFSEDFRQLSENLRRFSKLVRRPNECFRTFSENYRSLTDRSLLDRKENNASFNSVLKTFIFTSLSRIDALAICESIYTLYFQRSKIERDRSSSLVYRKIVIFLRNDLASLSLIRGPNERQRCVIIHVNRETSLYKKC